MPLLVANSISLNIGGIKCRRLDQTSVIMRMPQSHDSLSRRNIYTARAAELFQGTDVQITREGQRHLGAALGSQAFVETYVTGKVQEWVREVEQLAAIARSQPHAAYAAMTHGLSSKWTYLSRTIPNISDLFQPLENAIRYKCLPALTGRSAFTEQKRETC